MKVYFTQVERILNTLPVGYYAGRRIPASLSENAKTSFIDVIAQEIVISFPQIEETMERIEDETIVEQTIRNLLYHEVSHAILTSRNLFYKGITKKEKDIINIFEDERIETVLRHYYHNVDFRKNVERINNWDEMKKTEPMNAMDMYYRVVRFHVGKKEWLDKMNKIIDSYYFNNSTTMYSMLSYRYEINNFYLMIENEFSKTPADELSILLYDSDMFDGEADNKEDGYSDDVVVTEDKTDDSESNSVNKEVEDELDEAKKISEILEEVFKKSTDSIVEENSMTQDIVSIISNFNRKNSGGSAIASHSGVLNPRLVGCPDYRIFERKSSEKGSNKFCSVHINLFLDESGSYRRNVSKTNQLIYALAQAEKIDKNFTFDIVYCGEGERIVENKRDRTMSARGGNNLDTKIFEIYRKMQKPNTYNYNIVLFDGDAFTDTPERELKRYYKNFGAFNHSNCTIISDYDNVSNINKYAPSAKRIFTKNYVAELQKNVISALRLAFR